MSARGILGGVAVAAVVGAIGVGLYIVGRPADQRIRRIDEHRTQDLTYLRDGVARYAEAHKRLPESLQEVTGFPDASRRDPVTGQPYGYRVTGDATYDVCADFERATDPDQAQFADNTWKHGAGHTCFPQVAATLRQPKK
jgi:hypothetical protein